MQTASAVYLEKRISSNPHAPEIRKRFAELQEKNKDTVDALLAEYRGRKINEASDFHAIRKRVGKKVQSDLVESNVRENTEIDSDKMSIYGEDFNIADIRRLAGIK
jgi:hypothetical protein